MLQASQVHEFENRNVASNQTRQQQVAGAAQVVDSGVKLNDDSASSVRRGPRNAGAVLLAVQADKARSDWKQ